MEVLLADTADGSSVAVPAAETDLKTFTVRENNFPLISAEADISIASIGTSAAQAVTFRVRIGGLVKTYVYTSKAAIDNDYLHVKFIARHNDKSAIRITVQGAGADADTSVLAKNFYVFGVQHSQLAG